jgi:hypothetical protein
LKKIYFWSKKMLKVQKVTELRAFTVDGEAGTRVYQKTPLGQLVFDVHQRAGGDGVKPPPAG